MIRSKNFASALCALYRRIFVKNYLHFEVMICDGHVCERLVESRDLNNCMVDHFRFSSVWTGPRQQDVIDRRPSNLAGN